MLGVISSINPKNAINAYQEPPKQHCCKDCLLVSVLGLIALVIYAIFAHEGMLTHTSSSEGFSGKHLLAENPDLSSFEITIFIFLMVGFFWYMCSRK